MTFIDSTPLLDHPDALRTAMRNDGYLYLHDLAPRDQTLALRRAILEICADAGWVQSDPDLMLGRWTGAGPFTEGDPEYMAVYRRVINHPAFMTWADHPAFVALMAKVLDAPNDGVLAHRLRIGRITFPQNVAQTTAAHQDFNYIRGSADTYTIWTPLGDCPVELGGLAVLRGSHRFGFVEHELFREKKYANLGLSEDRLGALANVEWHQADFRLGDVLVFHSHTIHKALPNLTRDRLRLSTDNRYQRKSDTVAEIATKSHYGM